jgi:hypothetical protein
MNKRPFVSVKILNKSVSGILLSENLL